MKLSTKVNLLSTFITFLLLCFSFIGIFYLFKYFTYNTESEQLHQRGDELLVAIQDAKTIEEAQTILRAYLPSDGILHILDENEQTITRVQGVALLNKIEYEIDEDESYTISKLDDLTVMAITYPILWIDGSVVTVHLVQPLTGIDATLNQLKWILVVILTLAIIPVYLASQLLVRLIVKPIHRLTETMQQNIEQSRFEQLEERGKGKDEIAEMTKTYNELMHLLEENYSKQQQFVGNASHELKTPLTVIESYANLLQRRGFDRPDVNMEAMTAITEQTAQMKALIEQMLQLARASEESQLDWQAVAIKPVLTSIQQSMQQAYNRTIHLKGELDATLLTDEAKLRQILYIFLDNARKYSEEDITVTVIDDELLQIVIEDRGIGIPNEDIPHIFERFYRVAKDRNRKTGGTGLGLSIAKQFSDLIGATTFISSEVGIGTTVTIQLPKEGLLHG